MRMAFAVLVVAAASLPAFAQRDIPQPKGTWQQPKDFQVPKGAVAGARQHPDPKGINAVRTTTTKTAKSCERRLSVVGDALFDFDRANLRADAEETLAAAVPEIKKLGGRPNRIEGHTNSMGTDAYNLKLSEARARDRARLAGEAEGDRGVDADPRARQVDAGRAEHKADGKDDPEGRQSNRRVEVVFEGCA